MFAAIRAGAAALAFSVTAAAFAQAQPAHKFEPEINKKLRPTVLKLKPGPPVGSNTFTMGEWEPDETYIVTPEQGCESSWCTVLFWIVPAQVAGSYKTAAGEFNLKQDFQMLIGTMRAGGRTVPVEGKVRGEEITLTSGAKTWRGRKNGDSLELR